MKQLQVSLWLMLLFLLLAVSAAQGAEIYLSAAVSLKGSLDQLADSFARKNPGVRFVKMYGSSGGLAQQLESGAPVDIFIAANMPWMNYLEQRHLLMAESVTGFTFNSLVLVGRPDLRVTSMKDLLRLNRIAIGNPRIVPTGEYAMQALRNSYLLKQLERRLVLARDGSDCLMYAERGEVDAAIVYRTDALLARRSKILFAVPQDLFERIVYPMGMTPAGGRKREARAFFRYLQGAEAKAVLARYGFPARGSLPPGRQ